MDERAEGLLAQGVNLGQHSRDQFAVAPEFAVNCEYQVSQCLVVNLGYSFLYWSRVALPGNQIDPELGRTHRAVSPFATTATPYTASTSVRNCGSELERSHLRDPFASAGIQASHMLREGQGNRGPRGYGGGGISTPEKPGTASELGIVFFIPLPSHSLAQSSCHVLWGRLS